MKLETKYGVLEGTVEEFKELLEGKVNRSWLFTSKGYKIVNKDTEDAPKGTVLKHIITNQYEDTLGMVYIIHDELLDDYNMSWIDGKFKSFKDRKILLVQKEEYKVVKEDIYSYYNCNIVLKKGTVLLETEGNYEDSLGVSYVLHYKTVEDKLEGIYGASTGFHFEEHRTNNKLYKVTI